MSAVAKSWLWPDHVIGKRESRVLRETHNALVNLCNDQLKALKKYGRHKVACGYYEHRTILACNCGLAEQVPND